MIFGSFAWDARCRLGEGSRRHGGRTQRRAQEGRGEAGLILEWQRTAGNRAVAEVVGDTGRGAPGAGPVTVQRQDRSRRVDPETILTQVIRDTLPIEALIMIYARVRNGEPLVGGYPYASRVPRYIRTNRLYAETLVSRREAFLERVGRRARRAPEHLHHWYLTFVDRYVVGAARRELFEMIQGFAGTNPVDYLAESQSELLSAYRSFIPVAWDLAAPRDSLNRAIPDSYTVAAFATSLKRFREDLRHLLRARMNFHARGRHETESAGTEAAVQAVRETLERLPSSCLAALRDAGPTIVDAFDAPLRRAAMQALSRHGLPRAQVQELTDINLGVAF